MVKIMVIKIIVIMTIVIKVTIIDIIDNKKNTVIIVKSMIIMVIKSLSS